MNLLGWVLFVALEISLVAYASTSTCQKLNTTLLSDCTKAGYNVTELNPSRTQEELSGLISAMRSKFKNCSSLSSLMTCSVQLPKCPTSAPKKPCKEACKNFVSGCQNRSVENDGLIALFRGICELLPSKNCLPTPNNVTNSALDAVKCSRLAIKQCQNAGYNFTSVSDAYQQMVESSAIFQDIDVNSTLRKLICMEIAPPCDAKYNQTLIVPCRSMCDDAFNESQSKFVKVFKAQKYCSTFPESPENTTGDGKKYCTLQVWPDNGYWPSGLWSSYATAGQQPTPPAKANKTALAPALNVTTPTPIASATTPVPTVNTTTPSPTASATAPVPTVNTTTPTPTASATTPVPTVNATTPTPAASAPTHVPTVNTTTPTLIASAITPTPTASATTPVPTVNATTPTPTASATTPVPTVKTTTPTPTASATTPVPTNNTTTSTPTASATAPVPTDNTTRSTPTSYTSKTVSTTNVTPSVSKANGTTPAPTPRGSTTTPPTKGTTPTSTPNGKTTAPSTAPSTKRSTNAPTPRRSSTSNSSTSEMKGSSPTVVSASKGGKMSAGAIAGTVLGLLVLVLGIVISAICFRRYYRTKSQFRHSLMVDMDEL